MTRKVFWDDPYLCTLETTVASVAGDEVTLAASILYAESGGQESDHGSIAGWPVLAARKQGQDIVYTLPPQHGLQAGAAVTLQLDWPRRYRLMRLHFAAELVLETIYQTLPDVEKIGAHIAEHKARIDFALPQAITPHLPALQARINALIAANLAITSTFSDAASGRRYWALPGIARVPCGGTHLRYSGEVGRIALKRKNVGRGKERVEITLLDNTTS